MVSFVAGLEGVILVTVDMGVQSGRGARVFSRREDGTHDERSDGGRCLSSLSLFTRPRSGGRRTRKAQECSRRFCEVLVMAAKATAGASETDGLPA